MVPGCVELPGNCCLSPEAKGYYPAERNPPQPLDTASSTGVRAVSRETRHSRFFVDIEIDATRGDGCVEKRWVSETAWAEAAGIRQLCYSTIVNHTCQAADKQLSGPPKKIRPIHFYCAVFKEPLTITT